VNSYLPFIVSGIATGSIYGLAATGLVLTYKTSGVLNLDLGLDPTNGITGTGTYNLGDSTTVDLGIGAAAFDYGATYNILAFTSGTVGNISITDYDTSNFTASITDSGGTAVLSFTESGTAVPEPASLSILALGAAALLTRRKR